MTLHRLSYLAVSPDDATPIGTPGADPADTPEAAVPSASGALLTVAPYLVEAGDLLVDNPYARVHTLLSDGAVWFYYDADGVLIATWPHGTDVQVVRVAEGGP